ncbi:tannase and feruloyl esterase [Mycena albidolilacea]|uniref:Carboxylic ester hydrolase n=1 Tax=Mycena albidolilacea TaxID=1033008 RepID=A0AAD6ZRJ0_9AGAR|nr:tannase and feruloyl esterase [Mycena albidolilacea]
MDSSTLGLGFLSKLLTSSLLLFSSWSPGEHHTACLALKSSLNVENTTIIDVSYVRAGSKVATLGTCAKRADVSVPLCRVQFFTNTTTTSVVHGEAWLPDEWYGRFLGLGNGGLGGCIDYGGLDYGSSLHFATVGSNNGHDGMGGAAFLGHPEVINDFAFRAIHVEAVVGKQIVEAYYGRPHSKSYYMGCSTGGRQGTQAALKFPADFDGIVAGAPATDFNRLVHWTNMLTQYIGAPASHSSPALIPQELWNAVEAEVIRQCDGIDGVLDGIITEPDACDFRPEALLCHPEAALDTCLTRAQVEALRKIYSPLYGPGNQLLYPRFDPGAIYIPGDVFSGDIPERSKDWLQYAVLNDTGFDFREYGLEHAVLMDEINPGGVAAFDGDLSAFRDRGGKFITYHGRKDPASNSKRMYDLVSRTLRMPSLDTFYRLFLVPGMVHCTFTPGASRFGQYQRGSNAVNASSHNILLALVDWVEGGEAAAPDTIVGTAEDGATRVHCRYPQRSVWDAAEGRFGFTFEDLCGRFAHPKPPHFGTVRQTSSPFKTRQAETLGGLEPSVDDSRAPDSSRSKTSVPQIHNS